jgi:hypothetical protein
LAITPINVSDSVANASLAIIVELILHGLGTALMSNFRAIDRETGFLLPPSLRCIGDHLLQQVRHGFIAHEIDIMGRTPDVHAASLCADHRARAFAVAATSP